MLAAQKPRLQLASGRHILGIIVIPQIEPFALLGFRSQRQRGDGRAVDFLGGIGLADFRNEVREGKAAFDHQLGDTKCQRDLLDAAAFIGQTLEGFELAHFIRFKPRDVFQDRSLDGSGVVALGQNGAGQFDRLVAALFENGIRRKEAPPSLRGFQSCLSRHWGARSTAPRRRARGSMAEYRLISGFLRSWRMLRVEILSLSMGI